MNPWFDATLSSLRTEMGLIEMTYTKSLYETDEVAWSQEQVQLLRDRRWDELDLENLIEEIEDVGGRHRDAVESHLENLLMHLLKREDQP